MEETFVSNRSNKKYPILTHSALLFALLCSCFAIYFIITQGFAVDLSHFENVIMVLNYGVTMILPLFSGIVLGVSFFILRKKELGESKRIFAQSVVFTFIMFTLMRLGGELSYFISLMFGDNPAANYLTGLKWFGLAWNGLFILTLVVAPIIALIQAIRGKVFEYPIASWFVRVNETSSIEDSEIVEETVDTDERVDTLE